MGKKAGRSGTRQRVREEAGSVRGAGSLADLVACGQTENGGEYMMSKSGQEDKEVRGEDIKSLVTELRRDGIHRNGC